jgi:exo-beta-1,3-glucanase (GH17 family)
MPFSAGKGTIQLGSSVATTIEQVAYMLVAMANHVLNISSLSSSSSSSPSSSSSSSPYNALVVCFNEEAKEGDRGRVAVLDKVMRADES